ncbi:MAG: 4'-phosphopantetheinyl transferase superfamily protein [Rhizobacter sp.]|nr:4'-phosphopantetheinyl transferase superfamily protein [Rhizobacter sp.]
MLSWPPSQETGRKCLSEGDIIVALISVPGPIAAARSASRQWCNEWLARFPDHFASRSATAGLAAVALSKATHIGIDVERIDPRLNCDDDLLNLALDPVERAGMRSPSPEAFTRLWTCKESALKAAGVGLALPAATVHVGWQTCKWTTVGFGLRATSAQVCSLASPPGFAAAIATLGAPRSVRIVTQFTMP